MASPIVSPVPLGLMFRYLEAAEKFQSFKVPMDDRAVMAECRGTVHEFGMNTNECADGKYRLRDLVTLPATDRSILIPVSLNSVEHINDRWENRFLYGGGIALSNPDSVSEPTPEPVRKEDESVKELARKFKQIQGD